MSTPQRGRVHEGYVVLTWKVDGEKSDSGVRNNCSTVKMSFGEKDYSTQDVTKATVKIPSNLGSRKNM